MIELAYKALDLLLAAFGGLRRVRVLVHLGAHLSSGEIAYFVKIVNLSSARDVEVTHVWLEAEPDVPLLQEDRPLPVRLQPDQTWETWLPIKRVPASILAQVPTRVRVQLSNGSVFKSKLNKKVPDLGYVAGGPTVRVPVPESAVHGGMATAWYSEWRLGAAAKVYKETLRIQEHANGVVDGTRWIESADGATEYRVAGFARGGFYWLEYHDENHRGGGTLLLHEFTSGKLRGLITSANCDTGRIRCLSNQWIPASFQGAYDRSWQRAIGDI
ncbi:MAG TPA: hypothetical protein VGR02_13585 [Thermoanaerobaculia bacterium]|jgi:hypothetical protein|nr:hypothetical protein [Thermoanaerobaculia bacterium]